MKKKGIRYIKKYTMLTIACGIFGIGVALFVDPNDLAPGGFTGLAIMINRLIPVSTGMLYLILNIPVILLGIRKFGWKFTVSTLYSILAVSLFTDLCGNRSRNEKWRNNRRGRHCDQMSEDQDPTYENWDIDVDARCCDHWNVWDRIW